MRFRVLVADDEQLERRALASIISAIEGRDVEVLEASNGRQAVEHARFAPVDIAFLDIRMPGMDGLQAAHELKTLRPGIRIVFVTAFDHFDYAREAIRLGVDEYLVKPASAQEVRATALRLMDRMEEDGSAVSLPENAVPVDEGALALLEEELRSDLRRDEIDGRRLSSFFRLKGLEDGILLALILRPGLETQAATAVRENQVRRFAEFCERFLVAAGWHVLAEIRGAELRCIAAMPRSLEGMAGDVMARIKLVLDRLASDSLSTLGLRVLAGACPSPCAEGDTVFLKAGDALALARPDRPVVLLPAGGTDSGDALAGMDRRGGATVERALAYMHAHLADNLSLADVAQAVGSAPSHLSRLFGRYGSDTFVHVLCRERIAAAKSLLRTGQYRVKEVCAMVGFNDQAYFSRVFRKYEGLSPADFRAGDD